MLLGLVALCVTGCTTLNTSDSAALQGDWQGQEVGSRQPGMSRLTILGNALEFRGADPNEWYRATFILREDASPKQLVGLITECPAPDYVGKTVYAIYRLDGETLTLTGNRPGDPEVPISFETPGARKFVLHKML